METIGGILIVVIFILSCINSFIAGRIKGLGDALEILEEGESVGDALHTATDLTPARVTRKVS